MQKVDKEKQAREEGQGLKQIKLMQVVLYGEWIIWIMDRGLHN